MNDARSAENSGLRRRTVLPNARSRELRLRTVDLNGITLMMGSEGATEIYSGLVSNDCFQVWMVLGDGYGVTVDGVDFDCRKLAWIAPGKSIVARSEKPPRWLRIVIAADLILKWADRHQDKFDPRLLDRNWQQCTTRSPVALVSLARRLFRAESRSPEPLHCADAEQAARTQVLDALFGMLSPVAGGPDPLRRSLSHHIKLLNNALNLLEAHRGDAVRTNQLCVATGVSERTLRNLFHRYLGMSPHRYLMLRRLHAIRSRIRRAVPGDTLTRICAQHGVWDFGRFSRQYRVQFGELPSRSLHAARGSLRSETMAFAGDAG